jgi:hypothetical protein
MRSQVCELWGLRLTDVDHQHDLRDHALFTSRHVHSKIPDHGMCCLGSQVALPAWGM